MKRFIIPIVAVLFTLLFLFAAYGLTVSAQDATAEPTAEVTETPEQPPVVEVPAPNSDIFVMTGAQMLLYLVLAAFGGGGLLSIAFRFLDRKEVRDNAERAYEGMSPAQQEVIVKFVDGYEALSNRLLDFLKAVTDGRPNPDDTPVLGKPRPPLN